MTGSTNPRDGDWLIEEVPAPPIGSARPRELHFRLWVTGTTATIADERQFGSPQDAEWALVRRARRDGVDAWRVYADAATCIARFRPNK